MTVRQAMKRLDVLEAEQTARIVSGCDTCRGWPGLVIMDDDGNRSRPAECPDCGRLVPAEVTIHIVGVPLERI